MQPFVSQIRSQPVPRAYLGANWKITDISQWQNWTECLDGGEGSGEFFIQPALGSLGCMGYMGYLSFGEVYIEFEFE